MTEQHTHRHYSVDPDSIEIGTPGKGGALKVYGDFRDPEGFRLKIRNAIALKQYAVELLSGGGR